MERGFVFLSKTEETRGRTQEANGKEPRMKSRTTFLRIHRLEASESAMAKSMAMAHVVARSPRPTREGKGSLRRSRTARTQKSQVRRASEKEELDSLEQDIARFRERDARSREDTSSPAPSEASSGVQQVVDKVLVANFFVICGFLAWLVAGVVQKSTTDSTTWLDTWLALWQPLIQPSLGLEMLGAIVSGLAGKYLKK
eukprot:scaffold833_cov352-Pavlova_lutheri.AAC.24